MFVRFSEIRAKRVRVVQILRISQKAPSQIIMGEVRRGKQFGRSGEGPVVVPRYGLGEGYSICALWPTGVYGVAHPIQDSKWYSLVSKVVRGQTVECSRGGKEVHAADVAKPAAMLLKADGIAGEAYNWYDRYISEFHVATLAKELSGSQSQIIGKTMQPKHQIVTEKLRALGMRFGGEELLRQTIADLVQGIQSGPLANP